MSGSGHVLDMNNRIKQNRAQRPSKRPKFKENNRENIYSDSVKKVDRPNFKTIPKKKLSEILKRINERAKTERKSELVIYWIFFIIVLAIIILPLIWMN